MLAACQKMGTHQRRAVHFQRIGTLSDTDMCSCQLCFCIVLLKGMCVTPLCTH